MLKLFYEGGPLFMGILTLELLAIIVLALVSFSQFHRGINPGALSYVKSISLLAVMTGILGQFIGLYGAFQFIEGSGGVSPGILAAGLRVSSITTIYGLIIFVIGYLSWLALKARGLKPME